VVLLKQLPRVPAGGVISDGRASGAIFVGFFKNVKIFVIFRKFSEVNPERFPKDLGINPEYSQENGEKCPLFREFRRFRAQNGHFPEREADKSGIFRKFRGVDPERSRSEMPEDSITEHYCPVSLAPSRSSLNPASNFEARRTVVQM
jgi:hypothetical protein